MKRAALILGTAFVVLAAVLVSRAMGLKPSASPVVTATTLQIDELKVAEHLAGALRFKTISVPEAAKREYPQWLALHKFLEKTFPKTHKSLTRETVGSYSLLFTWPGTDAKLGPMLFLAHQDVVPISPGTEGQWTEPPFAGKIAGGFIWGRGALDDKASLLGLLETIEQLLSDGFQPKRTLYFAFGHDEEVGGADGAAALSALLTSRGVKPEAILDEGGFIARGAIPGVKRSVGLIGVAEKGYVSVEMIAKAPGGHSSMPPKKTAIGQLSAAIAKLEKNPLPAALKSPTKEMLLTVGPELGFAQRVAFANLWLFEPLVLRYLAAAPPTNASIRTTTAPTIFQAGIKDNVLPPSARAVVNFRLMPGETPESLLEFIKHTIDNPEIELTPSVHGLPSPVSDTSAVPYRKLRSILEAHVPEALVAPFLTIAGTDTKHYTKLTSNIYRFLPVPLGSEDIPRIHGVDERISVADYAAAIRFYYDAVKALSAE